MSDKTCYWVYCISSNMCPWYLHAFLVTVDGVGNLNTIEIKVFVVEHTMIIIVRYVTYKLEQLWSALWFIHGWKTIPESICQYCITNKKISEIIVHTAIEYNSTASVGFHEIQTEFRKLYVHVFISSRNRTFTI